MIEKVNLETDKTEETPQEQGIWRTYDDVTDGLSFGIFCPLQDHLGYLWLGNIAGLHRYDGAEFVSYTTDDGLVHNCVWALCEDYQGRLWIGTLGGISCFDGEYFANYTIEDGLADNHIKAIYEDHEKRMWIGSEKGLSCFDGERFTNYTLTDGLADAFIEAIYQDRKGRMWIGLRGGGISCLDGRRLKNYTTEDGLADNLVQAICEDRQGRLWFGTEKGISCFDGERFVNHSIEDGLIGNDVTTICEDHLGRLWLGTRTGVSCLDGERFINYTTQQGLLDNRVNGIIQDREGILWFSHPFSGLACFDSQTLQRFTSEPVTEALIQDMSGRLWFINENRLCCLSKDGLRYRDLDVETFSLLVDSRGRFWLPALQHGLYCYDTVDSMWAEKGRLFTTEDGLQGNGIICALEAKDGTIWAGTADPGCLCRFDEGVFRAIPTPHRAILRLFEDSLGRIWMATGAKGSGISCYDGQNLVTYTTEDGMPNDAIQSILEDDSRRIWIGTQYNLCCLDEKGFTTYGKDQGLFSPTHSCSAKDAFGHLWFGTMRGGIYRTDSQHFQMLTIEDGLPSNSITGLVPQPDGSMLIGTYRGIIRYRPTATTPPRAEIREVVANHVYSRPEELELTTVEADLITISYHSLSFATQRMRYSYILEGYNAEWQDTWDSQIRYENLPVGEYTFKVIAINRDLVYSKEPAALRLTIVPDQWTQLRAEYEAEIDRMQNLLELNHRVNSQETLSDTALAVVEGLKELGFDRAALWIRDIGSDHLHGLWGTDHDGKAYSNQDEIHPSESIPPDNGYSVAMDRSILKAELGIDESEIFLLADRDESIFEAIWGYPPPCPGYYERNENGDNIALCLIVEDERIGTLAVDNYITRRTIDQTSANLLSLVVTEMGQALANVALRESLAQSEAKSKAILDAIPDLMFRISRDGVFLDYKSIHNNDLYIPGHQIIGSNAREILPPEIADLTVQNVQKTLDSGTIRIYEYQMLIRESVRHYEARLVVSGEDEVLAIVREITERKLAEEREKEYIRDLTFLSRTAMEFVSLPLEDDIYEFIGKELKELAGDSVSIVVIVAFEETSDNFVVRSVFGLEKKTEAVLELLREEPVGLSIKAMDEVKLGLAKGNLVRLPTDFHELSHGKIPEGVSHELENALDVGEAYGMGFAMKRDLFGVALLFMKKEGELENRDTIKTFINQASVALRRRHAEEQINASLKEKEVLLKEIHHRVKNNLQVISSMLNLQSGHIKDGQTLQMFRESQSRVRSMALIHEKLYQSRDLAKIDFAGYIRDLANYLFRVYGANSYGIKLETNIDNVSLDIDTAIPCGLIVNELISNSLKYGFPADGVRSKQSGSRGEIRVELRSDNNGKYVLVVSDNGMGISKDLDFQKTESLGLQLVNTLTEQLEGTIELDRRGGTKFRIIFHSQNIV